MRIRLVPSCRQRRQSVRKGTESPRIAAHTTKSGAILAPPTPSLQLLVWWGCAWLVSAGPSGATVSLRGGLLRSGGVERQPGAHAWQEPHYLLFCIVWWTSPGALPPCHTLCGCVGSSTPRALLLSSGLRGTKASGARPWLVLLPSPPPCILCMHVVRPQRVLPHGAPRRALRSRQLSISSTHAARASMRRPAASTPTPGSPTR